MYIWTTLNIFIYNINDTRIQGQSFFMYIIKILIIIQEIHVLFNLKNEIFNL